MIIEAKTKDGGSALIEAEPIADTPFGTVRFRQGLGAIHIPSAMKVSDHRWPSVEAATVDLRKIWSSLPPAQQSRLRLPQRPNESDTVLLSMLLDRITGPTANPRRPSPADVEREICAMGNAVEIAAMGLALLPSSASAVAHFRRHLATAIEILDDGKKPNQATEVAEHVAQG